MKPSTIRACGLLIALGGLIWSIGWLQAGVPTEGVNDQVEIWTSGVYQIGLVALLLTMRATKATGTSRPGRFILDAEIGAVALAIAWTIPFLFDANRPNTGVLVVLDAFWPLSMLGLIIVGVLVVRAQRWPAPGRYLPLTASLLLPVDIIVIVAGLDEWGQIIVRSAYLAVTYTLLGLWLIRQAASLAEMTEGEVESTSRVPETGLHSDEETLEVSEPTPS